MTTQTASRTHETCRHEFYMLDCAEFERLIQRADDRCEICRISGAATKHGKLHIDHDSQLGDWAVRGLLCSQCNTRLAVDVVFSPEARAYLATPWRTIADRERVLFPPDPWAEWKQQLRALATPPIDRPARNTAIVRASSEGMTQQAIADAVGMRREQIRRIVRATE